MLLNDGCDKAGEMFFQKRFDQDCVKAPRRFTGCHSVSTFANLTMANNEQSPK